jgi:hypothetical protein
MPRSLEAERATSLSTLLKRQSNTRFGPAAPDVSIDRVPLSGFIATCHSTFGTTTTITFWR